MPPRDTASTTLRSSAARLVLGLALAGVLGCIDFDAKLAQCDAGLGPCATGGGAGGGSGGATGGGSGGAQDGGTGGGAFDGGMTPCPGTELNGFCWMNPSPHGEDHLVHLGSSEDDLWIASMAGHFEHWTPAGRERFQALSLLRNDGSTPVVKGLTRSRGVLVAFGQDMMPQVFDGGAWTPLPGASLLSNIGTVQAVVSRLDGTAVVANFHGDWFTLDGTTLTQQLPVANVASYTAGTLQPDGGVVLGVTLVDGGLALQLPGNTVVAVHESLGRPGPIWALWPGPDGRVWYSGPDCTIGWVDPVSLRTDAGVPCTGSPTIRQGRWQPELGAFVLVGTDATLFEAAPGALDLGGSLHTSVFKAGTGTAAELKDFVVFPDAGGLAFGEGGTLARRTAFGWKEDVAQERTNFSAALPFGEGALLAGGGSMVWQTTANGSASPLVESSHGNNLTGLWSDGTAVFLTGERQSIAQLDFTAVPPAVVFESEPGLSGDLSTITGPSVNGLWAAGQQGSVWRRVDAGVWEAFPYSEPGVGEVQFTSSATVAGAVYLGAVLHPPTATDPNTGALYQPLSDGGLRKVRSFQRGVLSLAQSPQGTLWIGGENTLVFKLFRDGGFGTETPFAPHGVDITGLVPLSDDDVWATGSPDGETLHRTDAGWRTVETGARRGITSAVVGRAPGRPGLLWLVGERGAVLRKALP